MNDQSPEALEGRLIAQRKVLGLIVAQISAGAAGSTLLDALDEMQTVRDHEEDPGVLPTEAYAIQAAEADELRLIAEASRRGIESANRE